MFFSPFEQFIVIPYFSLHFIFFDVTITNVTFILFCLSLSVVYILNLTQNITTSSNYIFPSTLDSHFHLAYLSIQAIIEKHIHVKYYQQILFPITFSLGIFLLLINLLGNLPLFMSLTSQFAVVSAFALPTIFGIFFWLFTERNYTFVRTFYAPGTTAPLAMVLLPIELLTYIMRPVSIICRLCSNIMSGHIIIKVCVQTAFSLNQVKYASSLFLSLLVSLIIIQLVPLLILEIIVSLIQTYVFLVIFCMFVADTAGHHYRH